MPEVPAVPGSARPLTATVSYVFSDDGPLARAVDEFEARGGQRAMADAVAGVVGDGGVLLAEAGTGTGKTLAYLVPAILSGRRALVSTGTKNLQEQIYFKDVPLLQRALGVTFTATCMKGRGNYLCQHRFAALRDDAGAGTPADRIYLQMVDDWAASTDTGDRAELADLPEDVAFWSDIAATAENCVGNQCPDYESCFVTRMRQRAAASDVVIVNHHLLCADAAVRQSAYGEVIPRCDVAIIDEAHQLEDVATNYFGVTVSNHRVDDLLRDGMRLATGGTVADDTGEFARALRHVGDTAREFWSALTLARYEGGALAAAVSTATTDGRVRVGPAQLEPGAEPGARLVDACDALQGALVLLPDTDEDLKTLGGRAGALRDDLRFFLRATDRDYVFYLEWRSRGVFLKASPVDVSDIIRQTLLDRFSATVFTSATLAVDGSFDYVRGRLGIGRSIELRLPSEFDYARQSILYLPPRMPSPKTPAFAEAVAAQVMEILKRTYGRAFVLFTSYAMLRSVQAAIADELAFPMLVQGSAPRSVLLQQFRSTPHAVLLATSSFWQGVDVVGDALSCVIIDRLPFASPAEPVVAARLEAIAERGGDGFADLQVPLAILALLQGLGRLLRHRRDRGVLAILDPRIRTMGYGQRFIGSLPPAPVTADLDDITRFFDRTDREGD
ncbi:MAG: ATP-dependent DNA helicase [Vicinamibacterales bacterium]|nr:ATP-dependent DNA helicase [Vicinamibacterales bacterium]